jgi:hypothetical protein
MIEVFDMAGKINIQDGKIKCSCKGANLEKFIQPWAAPNLCTKYRVSGGGIVKVSYTAYTML